jgi:hypothetical protein
MPSSRGIQFAPLTVVCCCGLTALGIAARAGDAAPASSAPPEIAAELPHLKPGLWEYRRTVTNGGSAKPQVSTVRRCVDPTAEIRSKMSMLKTRNCQFTPLSKKQDHYVSSWTCPTPNGPVHFRDVLIVKDLTSYEDVSEVHTAQRMSQQKIEATRVGECSNPETPAPQAPSR